MTATLLPSASEILVDFLEAQTDLVAIHGGRVGTRLSATLPAIRVQRVGGTPVEVYEDHPSMQVDCWGNNEDEADRLVRTLVAVLPAFQHTVVTGGQMYAYEVSAGPFWAPDDPSLSSNSRYIVTITLLTTT